MGLSGLTVDIQVIIQQLARQPVVAQQALHPFDVCPQKAHITQFQRCHDVEREMRVGNGQILTT